jgi:hypothetical protein
MNKKRDRGWVTCCNLNLIPEDYPDDREQPKYVGVSINWFIWCRRWINGRGPPIIIVEVTPKSHTGIQNTASVRRMESSRKEPTRILVSHTSAGA